MVDVLELLTESTTGICASFCATAAGAMMMAAAGGRQARSGAPDLSAPEAAAQAQLIEVGMVGAAQRYNGFIVNCLFRCPCVHA